MWMHVWKFSTCSLNWNKDGEKNQQTSENAKSGCLQSKRMRLVFSHVRYYPSCCRIKSHLNYNSGHLLRHTLDSLGELCKKKTIHLYLYLQQVLGRSPRKGNLQHMRVHILCIFFLTKFGWELLTYMTLFLNFDVKFWSLTILVVQ